MSVAVETGIDVSCGVSLGVVVLVDAGGVSVGNAVIAGVSVGKSVAVGGIDVGVSVFIEVGGGWVGISVGGVGVGVAGCVAVGGINVGGSVGSGVGVCPYPIAAGDTISTDTHSQKNNDNRLLCIYSPLLWSHATMGSTVGLMCQLERIVAGFLLNTNNFKPYRNITINDF